MPSLFLPSSTPLPPSRTSPCPCPSSPALDAARCPNTMWRPSTTRSSLPTSERASPKRPSRFLIGW
ncbi:hypothetical protein CsatA_013604 [Cannabis sativa]